MSACQVPDLETIRTLINTGTLQQYCGSVGYDKPTCTPLEDPESGVLMLNDVL